MIDPDRLRRAYHKVRDDLLAERCPAGHWVGELSSSALSTATATSALSVVREHLARGSRASTHPTASAEGALLRRLIARGVQWLARCQNRDGGWGDTGKSHSNVATTMLVRAAFHLGGAADRHVEALDRAGRYVEREGGVAGLRRRYGKDRTFAAPILTNCALAGLVPWHDVPPLPFELACLPHATFRFLGLPVVSYAIPALVAIGQARYAHRRPGNPITRLVRGLAAERSLEVVGRMQPASGGFLEAAPLTSFVVMGLAASGRVDHPVVRRGVEFLTSSVRDDGSWPIDTNLATWVTTLSIGALAGSGEDLGQLRCLDWLLSCQHQALHPFTHAPPGGWAWTDLAGGVPDGDDTPAALLALAALRGPLDEGLHGDTVERMDKAAEMGLRWLLGLQNADGGWPTFCRGWGKLPFDRSAADLTAHAVRALNAWVEAWGTGARQLGGSPAEIHRRPARPCRARKLRWVPRAACPFLPGPSRPRIPRRPADNRASAGCSIKRMLRAIHRGLAYLAHRQRPGGSWVPLWFGNQDHPDDENPVYGTSRVLLAYRDLGRLDAGPACQGLRWLAVAQNPDGGWGGSFPNDPGGGRAKVSSVEESAVATEALIAAAGEPRWQAAAEGGTAWLIRAVESGRHREPAPIGFYFAKLWYYERLYPLVFSVSALGQALRRYRGRPRLPNVLPKSH